MLVTLCSISCFGWRSGWALGCAASSHRQVWALATAGQVGSTRKHLVWFDRAAQCSKSSSSRRVYGVMPFIGKDWRDPGEAWIRCAHTDGWEQMKLRPIQMSAVETFSASAQSSRCSSPIKLERVDSATSLSSNDENGFSRSDAQQSGSESDDWIPHCYIKKGKSKEFIGCTSMSEAFHRLNLARAVRDIRKFNYISKVVQILVQEKLHNLSATARKSLLAIIQAMVLLSIEQDVHISTARSLVRDFATGLGLGVEGHLCGSPKLISKQMGTASDLLELISERKLRTLADSEEGSMTFMDLPREILSIILRKLPDYTSLLEVAEAHETLKAIVQGESKVWSTLCQFHFSQQQIEKHLSNSNGSWRHTFFELKKFYGLRVAYADLIHLCCHCRAMFWKDHGHPCLSDDAPSVSVMPEQFVDMLLFL
ncbi:F-box only protein 25 [Toxocara canis]|uniref:F-box only protein 25 n=1 Tax=Toxocara canis TaxID=6265 RepID=A0A0B2VFM2_TOXCA|nr:F-box only protein 25 [Toxocara canis]